MPFQEQLAQLKSDLVAQGRLVSRVIDTTVESVFERDAEKARRVMAHDEEIDREDVRIEKTAVSLLIESGQQGEKLEPSDVRLLLTIVKVNNEFERIADRAVNICEKIDAFINLPMGIPAKFRVMANSVVGIMQNTNTALDRLDTEVARLVLASDDANEAFKVAILQEVESMLAGGDRSVDFAIALHTMAENFGRMTDHCTNVCEQVIYVATGKIVRHQDDRWTEPEEPV